MGNSGKVGADGSSSAETVVQLFQALLEQLDILRARRLELTLIGFVNVRDFARLDGSEKPYQPVSLLAPILAHNDLRAGVRHSTKKGAAAS